DLDARGPPPQRVARLPGPGEVAEHAAAEPPGEDVGERLPLPLVAPLVHVEEEAPRRAGLVVVIAGGHHRAEAGQVDVAGTPLDDRPGERRHADAVRGAPARPAADPPAGADRLAVARLQV